MAIYSAGDTIYVRKGDSGNVKVTGLPTDKNYAVCLSVFNEEKGQIIKEWVVFSNYSSEVTFSIPATDTDTLPVGEHTYGIKICANGQEDTLIPRTEIENGKIVQYSAPIFTVDTKYVEGQS